MKVQCSCNTTAVQIVFIYNKDVSIRLSVYCIDLMREAIPDKYSLQLISKLLAEAKDGKWFASRNLNTRYCLIKIARANE